MKIHRFYKKIKDETNNTIRYELYAITTNKKYAKEFALSRDMNQFIYKVSKESREAWIEFAEIHRGLVLEMIDLDTYKENKSGLIGSQTLSIVGTAYESQCITDEYEFLDINTEVWWQSAPPPWIFKSKYKKALKAIQYWQWYMLYNYDNVAAYNLQHGEEIDVNDPPNITIDQYNEFLMMFGDTFKL